MMKKNLLRKDEILVMKFTQDWIYETISEQINNRASTLSKINDISDLLITTKFFLDKDNKQNLAVFLTDDSQIDKIGLISEYHTTDEYGMIPLQEIDKSVLLPYGVQNLSVDSCLNAISKKKEAKTE